MSADFWLFAWYAVATLGCIAICIFISRLLVGRGTFFSLVLGILLGCGVSGIPTLHQRGQTHEAYYALIAAGYSPVEVEAPLRPFQNYEDVRVPYWEREHGFVNGEWFFTSPGHGYANLQLGTRREVCASPQPNCLKVEVLPCIVRYGLWHDDLQGWYLVPGSASVSEDPSGVCMPHMHELDRLLLRPRKAHAFAPQERTPGGPLRAPGVLPFNDCLAYKEASIAAHSASRLSSGMIMLI